MYFSILSRLNNTFSNNKNYVVYISILNNRNHYETICSIKTISNFNQKIIIYTDCKSLFLQKFNQNKNIILETISQCHLKKCKENFKYIFELKIILLINFSKKYCGNLIYLDSDTFIKKNINHLFKKLGKNTCILHVYEYRLSSAKNKNYFSFFQKRNICQNIDGVNYDIGLNSKMWNSGVIGLSHKNLYLLSISHAIYKKLDDSKINERTIEQLAISTAFNTKKIISAEKYVFHYWFMKIFIYFIWKFFHEKECINEVLSNDERKFIKKHGLKLFNSTFFNFGNFENFIFNLMNKNYSVETKKNILKNFNSNSQLKKKYYLWVN